MNDSATDWGLLEQAALPRYAIRVDNCSGLTPSSERLAHAPQHRNISECFFLADSIELSSTDSDILISAILCIASLILCFAATRRSIVAGVIATMAIGYFYGIVRGNIEQSTSHFIYDAGVLGLYLAALTRFYSPLAKHRMRRVVRWVLVLTVWPLLIFLIPSQDFLIRLVGLRASIFFLPFLMVGAMMDVAECRQLARALTILNAMVLAIALAEVTFGLAHFFAVSNPVNLTIFRSQDIIYGGSNHYRIPATFVSSAAYGTDMVGSIPFLIGGLMHEDRRSRWRYFILSAVGFAAVGVFLSGSRSAVAFLLVLALFVVGHHSSLNLPRGLGIASIAICVALVAFTPRMQRFITLQDTDYLARRVHGSVNSDFIARALDYPMGNGLGGGGTSLPYFLHDRVSSQVVLENEYARIMFEQGIPGLLLWLSFIGWLTLRQAGRHATQRGKSIARVFCLLSFATAPLGLGLLDAIPGTEMLLILAGWCTAPDPVISWARQSKPTNRRLGENAASAA